MSKAESSEGPRPYEVDWAISLKRVEAQSGDASKASLRQAISHLRGLLGEDFLLKAFRLGFGPAYGFKLIWVWDKNIVLDFYSLLSTCNGFLEFERVFHKIRKCKHLDQMQEKMSLLRTACLFSNQYEVQFEPKLKSINKEPDLLLVGKDNGNRLYVEISDLEASADSRKAKQQMHLFFTEVMHGKFGVEVRGKLESVLTGADAQNFYRYLEEHAYNEANVKGIFIYCVPGKLKFIAYLPTCYNQALQLARENGFELHGIEGPIERSEFYRLPLKIDDEAEQLSGEFENIIVIWSDLLLVGPILHGLPFANELESVFDTRAHVSGVVLAHVFPNDSLQRSVHPDILQFTDVNGMLYSFMLVFRKGNERLKAKLRETLLKNSVT